ncbi:helix-turn-helix domain-containing protein [Chitinophaga tropicalis]|uniref:Helix-turn-helix domain-containing protein n=1 Tax=Chitinophaga tropicalis TaxID=2683588 RepID=A0A7K1U214_9BACT|nr:helix-turn-helix domain-containing protein [Chitinophaga tropicalis]MVT08383.1 helix-turn-helix domain-containing protein [Chitinophaga tropicalis]
MQHQEFEPPEELQDTIKCFWYDRRDFGDVQSSFEVLPDGYAEIIFHFGSACSISYNGGLQSLPSPFMVGLLNQPVLFYTQNRLEIIGIRCFPWTVFDLLGLPSGKDGVRIFEHPIAQLQSALDECIHAGRIEEAMVLVKAYFLNARSHIAVDSMLFKAGIAMREAKGTMPVSQVAAAAHATVRTLERNFKQSSGHTVKDVSGLMRFEQARNQLWLYPDSNIAGLAHELGYTDQSHLSREFKRYSGTTPAAFARRAKKGKKVVSKEFVAFIQS